MNLKKKKVLEITCILLILTSFLTIGYCTYKSYKSKKENKEIETKVDNYYNIDYLFNNDYIKKADNIKNSSDENKTIYMYLDKTNTLHIKIKNKEELNKTVTDLPKEVLNVYYSKIDDETYELAAISKQNSLYYARININSKDSNKFQEIGQNVQDVYKTTYDKEKVYVYETKNFKTNFIIAKENKTLEYITYSKNKYETHKSLNEERPYFNYICALEENDICKKTIVYQTFDDNIMLGYNKEKTIRDELKKEIVVKEMFSVLKLKKDTEITSLTYKKLNKKTDYLYTIYIVDKEDELYKIEINSNVIKSKEIPTALKSADKKVKQIKYDTQDNSIKEVHIIYIDGKEEKITKENNLYITTSTVYDRNKNKIIKTSK